MINCSKCKSEKVVIIKTDVVVGAGRIDPLGPCVAIRMRCWEDGCRSKFTFCVESASGAADYVKFDGWDRNRSWLEEEPDA